MFYINGQQKCLHFYKNLKSPNNGIDSDWNPATEGQRNIQWCEMLLCEVGFATKHEYRTLPSPPSPHQAPLEVPTETATLPESDLLPTGPATYF